MSIEYFRRYIKSQVRSRGYAEINGVVLTVQRCF